eukprot:GEMP01007148.1.p1 GENE.GEMP01007148.1~~GEMP01007148.1.p1  ORF type:complete len:814 (+),score=175.60 GEMP01007148.1:250-2691(+)
MPHVGNTDNNYYTTYPKKTDDEWESWRQDANRERSYYQSEMQKSAADFRGHEIPADDDQRRRERELKDLEERRKAQRKVREQRLAEENKRKLFDEKWHLDKEKLLTPESGILTSKLYSDGKMYVAVEVQPKEDGGRPYTDWIAVQGQYYCKWCDKNLRDSTLEAHLESKMHIKGVDWKQPRRASFWSDTEEWKEPEYTEEWFEKRDDEWGGYVQCVACDKRADEIHVYTPAHLSRVKTWKDRTKVKVQPIEEWLMYVFWYPNSTKEYDLGVKCLLCERFCQDVKSHGADPDKASKEHQKQLTNYGYYEASMRKKREKYIRNDKTGLIKKICDRQTAPLLGPHKLKAARNPKTNKVNSPNGNASDSTVEPPATRDELKTPPSSSEAGKQPAARTGLKASPSSSEVEKRPAARAEVRNPSRPSGAPDARSKTHSVDVREPSKAAATTNTRSKTYSVNAVEPPKATAAKDITPKPNGTNTVEPSKPVATTGNRSKIHNTDGGELSEPSGAKDNGVGRAENGLGQAKTLLPKAPATVPHLTSRRVPTNDPSATPMAFHFSLRQGPAVPPGFTKGPPSHLGATAPSATPLPLDASLGQGPAMPPVCTEAAPVQACPRVVPSSDGETESSDDDMDCISRNWITLPNDLHHIREPPPARPPVFSSAADKASRSIAYPELEARDDRSRMSTSDEWLNDIAWHTPLESGVGANPELEARDIRSWSMVTDGGQAEFIVTHQYNARECTLTGEEEFGYLELYMYESITLLSEALATGERHNQYQFQPYGFFEDTRGKSGWAPMTCMKKKVQAPRLPSQQETMEF